jgi:hypothetical protein
MARRVAVDLHDQPAGRRGRYSAQLERFELQLEYRVTTVEQDDDPRLIEALGRRVLRHHITLP